VCEDGKLENKTDRVEEKKTERRRDRQAGRQIKEHTKKNRELHARQIIRRKGNILSKRPE